MLVLSRKIGQRIVLPESGVNVVVLAVSGKRVRLGIKAPMAARVHREEVWQRICDLVAVVPDDAPMEKTTCECSAP
ncbi:MAG: hypothetical protein A2V70_07110 [Planctomycetes bacterium RBG_13_63_9]|nr:MAG: hypothetical protein A2V70_07110 [Planctomycetes bacterium RBG_13_63_9]